MKRKPPRLLQVTGGFIRHPDDRDDHAEWRKAENARRRRRAGLPAAKHDLLEPMPADQPIEFFEGDSGANGHPGGVFCRITDKEIE